MGLLDFFKKGPNPEAIASQMRKAKEHYGQPEYRRMAMDKLLEWDTDESLKALLERWTAVVQSPHWDEEEKRWLVDEMVKRGERVIPILREFVLEKNEVNYAILTLRKLISDDQTYSKILVEALQKRSPSDHRSVQAKREIIAALSDLKTMNFEALFVPYLEDHSDDVQALAIESLAQTREPSIVNKMLALLTSEEHSARVSRLAAKIIAEHKIPVATETLSEAVREEFTIKDGFLTRLSH